MAQINLSAWAIRHSTLMHFFMLLVALAGVHAYFALGQDEDPPFTVRTMVVRAYLPGATIDETMRELTDRIEKKLEETPYLDYLKSYTTPGEATIFVNLLSGTPQSEVPECWYQVRKKVGDISYTLPSETVGPYFDDEFGDTYGIIYAFTADGFTHRELKDYVEEIRKKLLSLQYVGKITTIGEQDEKYYVEFSPHRLAKLGISQNAVISAIQQQNALTPSGTVDTDSDKIAIESSGRFHSESDIANVTLYAGSQKIRLGDVATVTHGYADPPTPHFRCNGKDAIGLAINMSKGGNVLKLKENVENAMARILTDLPVGIETTLVANQPAVVHDSVNEFTEALFEAVAIVLGVSFLSLGLRAGTVVACSIPLVLAFVFLGMQIFDIDLQRVSLGALIISLGLLVDDAMITIESMVSRLELGWDKMRAATYAYTTTAFPMLTGTLVTILGFVPIGLAKSMAGEYCFTLFAIVGMALVVSWFVAVLFAPVIAMSVLPDHISHAKTDASRFAGIFHKCLVWCMHHPKTTVIVTLAAFILSIEGMKHVPQQFFPHSTRPEVLVDMTLPQNSSIEATDEVSRRIDDVLSKDNDVDHWTSYVGRGAIRFYLPLDEQLENDFFAQSVIVTKGDEERERVIQKIQNILDNEYPQLTGRAYAMELGPPVGWPVQFRVSGPDQEKVQEYAHQVAGIMAASPDLEKINFNWAEKQRKLKIEVRQSEARRLGLSSSAIAKALYASVSGATVTQVRDDIYLIDVILRARKEDRTSIEQIRNLDVQLPNGSSVPLSVLADVTYTQDYPLIWRRDRQPTVTVQAQAVSGKMPETVALGLMGKMEELEKTMPPGYGITIGGPVEESNKSTASVVAVLPMMCLLMLTVLMIQLQNFVHLGLVICVAPFGLIGVVLALGLTGNPMGFVALVGIVALVGMIIRNSVILVHQIGVEKKPGVSDWDALMAAATIRFRPIMLTAVAAILGMLPIAPTVFWGPMANSIMGGLAVATALTLLFLPALYVLIYRLKDPGPRPAPAGEAAAPQDSGSGDSGNRESMPDDKPDADRTPERTEAPEAERGEEKRASRTT